MSRYVEGLSPAERAELERRLLSRRQPAARPQAIGRRAERGIAPLSSAQLRQWFFAELNPGSSLYHIPRLLRLTGSLRAEALQEGLDLLVARHETLRTSFAVVDEQPVQLIAASARVHLALTDLAELPVAQREAELDRRVASQLRAPFDLRAPPLLRAELVRFGATEHLLLLTVHHIVSDGWSMGILVRELLALYRAVVTGRPAGLPDLPIQYADFASWQRERFQGVHLEAQLSYWRARLDGAAPLLELPYDRPRPPVESHRGSRLALTFPNELVGELRALARREGATEFMVLLAAFKVLLARCSGQDDIVIGSPIAGRTHVETEALIGCFANTLALRTDLSRDRPFREVLGQVRENLVGAYAHQELPFERLVEELGIERSPRYHPVFQVLFNHRDFGTTMPDVPGLGIEELEIGRGGSYVDFSVSFRPQLQGLTSRWLFSTDLFDAATIERLARCYLVLLEAVAARPDCRVNALPLLTGAQARARAAESRGPTRPLVPAGGIHELVSAQAGRTPDAPAVVHGARTLRYAELDTRARRLAGHLRALGVGPESRIGLCLEPSVDRLVALLGVLHSGGAYVPLDPGHPPDRLAFQIADAGVQVLVTDSAIRLRLPSLGPGVSLVCLDEDAERLAEAEPTSVAAATGQLAYVLYTSGATGSPKGVAVPHGAVTSFALSAARAYTISPADRVLQFSPLTSDFTVEEIFPAWLSGAAVVLRDPGLPPSGTEFTEMLARERVTAVFLPTAFWHHWIGELHRAGGTLPPTLRIVSIGGETPHPRVMQLWRSLNAGNVRWFNTYGPTEATVEVTIYECRPDRKRQSEGPSPVPLGDPLPGASVYVLDRNLDPTPVGVPGELFLGGTGLARGYLDRPALTAERFVPDPFSDRPGARLYRTGDRARRLADGRLVFAGRMDHQVKIRGYRVEPGEAEAALLAHPEVGHAVAVPREDATGERRLVAYAVPMPGATATEAGLRGFLRARLPEHIVPSRVVLVDRIPLTRAGKVDRSALPDPDLRRPEPRQSYIPPRSPLEERVAGVWAAVLGLERVGVHDSFFELGGHSLLATQAVTRLRTELGTDVPLLAIFEAPTVAGLAERLEAGCAAAGTPEQRITQVLDGLADLTDEEASRLFAVQDGGSTA